MPEAREALESQLNANDAAARSEALDVLIARAESGAIAWPEPGRSFNLHCHSFFSFNGYGYSPSALAWHGRCQGLCAMGLVDFDVLDGVDEFLDACGRVGLRACAGIETRIFVPEFGDREINSPGEPGISYHMGVGFTQSGVADPLLPEFKDLAQGRYRGMVDRVNAYLAPVSLDYDTDALSLTPSGNATERHLCRAYDEKSQAVFPEKSARVAFWAEKLGVDAADIESCIDDGPAFQGLIRSKTMKRGGVGYVQPEGPDFPRLDDTNRFARESGAIPTLAYLDGTTAGEAALDELIEVMTGSGVAAVNIIPDRNWNIKDPETKRTKVANLNAFIAAAQARHLPIVVGTEMNAFGQRFVDDFDAPELAPHYDAFLDGVYIVQAHTLLEAKAAMGYLSPWAEAHFADTPAKNAFYRALGARVAPGEESFLDEITTNDAPEEITQRLGLEV